jgi:inorganic pyrophosphatase
MASLQARSKKTVENPTPLSLGIALVKKQLEDFMIRVFIQVEAGSCDRNFYNEKTLEYAETRRFSRPFPYPYGFILGTSAADGDNVDCYLIAHDQPKSGTIVECEPVGLLVQVEDGAIDHKVLAAIPDQSVNPGQGLLQELQDFIYGIIAEFPDVHMSVGPILPKEAALRHIQACRHA